MRCAACKQVVWSIEDQYQKVVEASKDKTFKVGHRMQNNQKWQNDDKRKRKYVGSEIFADEVIEHSCGGLSTRGEPALEEYTGKSPLAMSSKAAVARVLGRSMENFCQSLVEEHEEDLKGKIMQGEAFEPKNLGKRLKRWLCYRSSGECSLAQVEGFSGAGQPIPPEITSFMGPSDDIAAATESMKKQLEQDFQKKKRKTRLGSIYDDIARLFKEQGLLGMLRGINPMVWADAALIGVVSTLAQIYFNPDLPPKDYSTDIKAAREKQSAQAKHWKEVAAAQRKQD